MATHLVISDTQVKPESSLEHIKALGQMVASLGPDVVINLGDWWDFPSLSKYDYGKRCHEGARYQKDVVAGNDAMLAFWKPIKERKKKLPRMVFCVGNHEHRVERHVEEHAVLEGKVGMDDLYLAGWEVVPFLEPVKIDGVHYAHYFYNPMSGRPYGGTMQNIINKLGYSFTQGHVQKLDVIRKDLTNGKVLMGMVTGSYYPHDERYKGPQGNHHWRGVIVKRNVRDGYYDYETWEIDRVLREFG